MFVTVTSGPNAVSGATGACCQSVVAEMKAQGENTPAAKDGSESPSNAGRGTS